MSRVLWLALAVQFGMGRHVDAWLLGALVLVRLGAELLAASRATAKLAPWLDAVLLAGLAASSLDTWPSSWRPG